MWGKERRDSFPGGRLFLSCSVFLDCGCLCFPVLSAGNHCLCLLPEQVPEEQQRPTCGQWVYTSNKHSSKVLAWISYNRYNYFIVCDFLPSSFLSTLSSRAGFRRYGHLLFHVAGQQLLLGQNSFWYQDSDRPDTGASAHLSLQSSGEQMFSYPGASLVTS